MMFPPPTVSPEDEGPEGHVYCSRGEPKMASGTEGRAGLSGSGWFWLADSCCNNTWDEPEAWLTHREFQIP